MSLLNLFRPAWKHSDPAIRLKSLDSLPPEKPDLLLEIATTDPDDHIRLAAAERIDDLHKLEKIASSDPGGQVLDLVTDKLNRHWQSLATAARTEEEAKPILDNIHKEEIIAEIACEAKSPEVRLVAVHRLGSEKYLVRVAESNCGKEVGEIIVGLIREEENLQRLAKSGSNKAIRRQAKDRLDAIEAERNRPSEEEIRQQKLKQLLILESLFQILHKKNHKREL